MNMEKHVIEKELKSFTGGLFITQGQLKQALGCGNDTVSEVLKGMDYIRFERTKRYSIKDVAQRLWDNRIQS